MDHLAPCPWLLAVEHIVIAFFTMVTAIATTFLVHRRIRADKERRALKCPECRALDQVVHERKRRGNGL